MVLQTSALLSAVDHSSTTKFYSSDSLPAQDMRRAQDTVFVQRKIRKASGYPVVDVKNALPSSGALGTLGLPLWIHLFLEAALFGRNTACLRRQMDPFTGKLGKDKGRCFMGSALPRLGSKLFGGSTRPLRLRCCSGVLPVGERPALVWGCLFCPG